MSANHKKIRRRGWICIVIAFLLGAGLGFVAILVTMMVLQAAISYAQ